MSPSVLAGAQRWLMGSTVVLLLAALLNVAYELTWRSRLNVWSLVCAALLLRWFRQDLLDLAREEAANR